ncbi:hypothetical protein HS088_TW13G01443 [Tripterygium wilfordii]|uniref:Uncharacterized protein n=1 Tax=Tripterygium wilfordii TaxID=458696 RepID=A0A7J7CWU4_TRIWF|nr:hypothetical protein HS088_TW13G01443 [Tripterygium wilfordii]
MGFPSYAVITPSGERAHPKLSTMDEVLWKGIHEMFYLFESDAEKFVLETTNLYDMVFIDAYDGDDVFPSLTIYGIQIPRSSKLSVTVSTSWTWNCSGEPSFGLCWQSVKIIQRCSVGKWKQRRFWCDIHCCGSIGFIIHLLLYAGDSGGVVGMVVRILLLMQ